MIKLLLDSKFYYFGETAEVKLIANENKNISVTFNIVETGYSWSGQINNNGYCDTTFSITKNYFQEEQVYTLKTQVGSSELQEDFAISYKSVLMKKMLDYLLTGFRKIGVWDEMVILNDDLSCGTVAFGNWIWQDNERKYYHNQNVPLEEFVHVLPDYDGRIYVLSGIDEGDEIHCSYKFRYFTDLDFSAGLDFALSLLNSTPPMTSYTFRTCPKAFDAALVLGAYKFLLERVLNDLSFFDQSTIFRAPDQLRSDIQTRLSQATSTLQLILGQKGQTMLARLTPRGISGYRYSVPYVIDQYDWRYLTIGQITLV